MKPFNLEAALSGQEVITRDGRKVSELHRFDTKNGKYKIVAAIDGSLEYFNDEGGNMNMLTVLDLFMAPQQVTKWVNVEKWYTASGQLRFHHSDQEFFDTKEEALAAKTPDCIATTSITFEI